MSQSIRDKWCEKEISDIDYIRHLEAEIVKLKEPLSCEGCRWNDLGDSSYKPIFYPCRSCTAHVEKHFTYNYEPNEQK